MEFAYLDLYKWISKSIGAYIDIGLHRYGFYIDRGKDKMGYNF